MTGAGEQAVLPHDAEPSVLRVEQRALSTCRATAAGAGPALRGHRRGGLRGGGFHWPALIA